MRSARASFLIPDPTTIRRTKKTAHARASRVTHRCELLAHEERELLLVIELVVSLDSGEHRLGVDRDVAAPGGASVPGCPPLVRLARGLNKQKGNVRLQ